MEREILFRGKQVDTGKWLQGFLSQSRNIQEKPAILKPCIDYEENGVMMFGMVDPKTVGQFTGLTDKNGKKIFEGDIIEHECGERHEVIFNVKDACVGTYYGKKFYYIHVFELSQFEVVGNVHDNPEFLK